MSIRIRKGQTYLESGEDGTSTMQALAVVTVEPLTVRRIQWEGGKGDPFPYDAEKLRALPMRSDPDLEMAEIGECLIGRTITGVEIRVEEGDWPQGDGDVTLVLDNGRRVMIESWGYDANGSTVRVEPPMEEQA